VNEPPSRLDINTTDVLCSDTEKGTVAVNWAYGHFNFSAIFILAVFYEFEELLKDDNEEILRDHVRLIIRLGRLKAACKKSVRLRLTSVQILQIVQWANNSITRLERDKEHTEHNQRIRSATSILMEWIADNEYNPFTF